MSGNRVALLVVLGMILSVTLGQGHSSLFVRAISLIIGSSMMMSWTLVLGLDTMKFLCIDTYWSRIIFGVLLAAPETVLFYTDNIPEEPLLATAILGAFLCGAGLVLSLFTGLWLDEYDRVKILKNME